MNLDRILSELRSERDRLDEAIAAMEKIGGTSAGARGRSAGSTSQPKPKGRRGPRHMSAAARKRISEMMKLRWAERRKKSA